MNLKLSETITQKLGGLLEKVVPAADDCREVADKLRHRHPGESPERLAGRAVRAARKAAAAVGAATGSAASPITMIPAAMADIAAVLRIEGRLAGVVCALLDPEGLDDVNLRSDVFGILFPGAVSQVLRQVGVRASQRAGKNLIRKYVSEDSLKLVLRLAARHLGMELTRKGLMEKTVPLIGVGVGASWNWLEVGVVGRRAIRYYRPGPPPLPSTETSPRRKRVRAFIQRLQPWKQDDPDDLIIDPAIKALPPPID